MDRLKLNAQVRSDKGTRKSKRLRKQGIVPAVLYGVDMENLALGIDDKELNKVLHGKGGGHALIDLQVGRGSSEGPLDKTVIIKEIQRDHLRDSILHVDFAAISLTEKLVTQVAVVDFGEAVGVTQGGILEHIIRELEVECLPTDIPEKISVDVSGLAIGKSIRVGDIASPPGVKILDDPSLIVITVSVPKVEVEKEEVAAEEAAAAEGAPAEGEEKKAEGEKEEAKGKEKEQSKDKSKEKSKEKEK